MFYIYIHTHIHFIATVQETRVVLLGKQGCSSHTSSATYCAVLCDVSVFTSVVCDIFNDDGVCAGRCVVIGVRCLPMVVCGSFSDFGVCAGRCVVRCPVFTDGGLRHFQRRWSSLVLLHVHRDRTDYYCIRVCAGRWILRMTMTGSDLRAQ